MGISVGQNFAAAIRRLVAAGLVFFLTLNPALALDPLYEGQMERLLEMTGSLYFLQPLCGDHKEDWRAQAAELIALDQPDEDRQARLIGAFNKGYEDYARLYRTCTPSAWEAMSRLLLDAEKTARNIHARYAE